jgi:hypothetical protein
MPLIETKGAASAQGFGEFAKTGEAVYIESCFSTYLYTGNGDGTTGGQTITNGIDLSTKGGLIWTKSRSDGTQHQLCDTARGINKFLRSDVTNGQYTASSNTLTSFNSNGYSMGADSTGNINYTNINYASWTFRKQPKFFDVVTWTGDNADGRFISHSLGSVPGMVIIKNTSSTYDWVVWHRSLANPSKYLVLNSTAATATDIYGPFGSYDGGFTTNSACFTSTGFYVAADARSNLSGNNYVAYVFAHDAGGFGLTGTDNVISCGSYTGNGSTTGPTITLGYEPQWVMIKNASSTGDWVMQDVMRGMPVGGNTMTLFANLSNAEVDPGNSRVQPTATGFQIANTASASLNATGNTYIYIAIRRGPMKTPTTGTSVYSAVTRTGTGAAANVTAGFAPDLLFFSANLSGSSGYAVGWFDRLRGTTRRLVSNTTGGESNYGTDSVTEFGNTAVTLGVDSLSTGINFSGQPSVDWMIGRAPGFFDVVCYTGTGANLTLNHNLGVTPELIITKRRNGATYGAVYASSLGVDQYLELFSSSTGGRSAAQTFSGSWLTPTSTTFGVGVTDQNLSAATYVAYLFSTVVGVSKVGSYTGNGSSQTINCGFTGGARFVLIKKTSGTGDWVVFDSARGIVSGNDPFLELNTTAAEQTGQDAVDTDSTGFVVNETTESLNANGGTYLFLAIA